MKKLGLYSPSDSGRFRRNAGRWIAFLKALPSSGRNCSTSSIGRRPRMSSISSVSNGSTSESVSLDDDIPPSSYNNMLSTSSEQILSLANCAAIDEDDADRSSEVWPFPECTELNQSNQNENLLQTLNIDANGSLHILSYILQVSRGMFRNTRYPDSAYKSLPLGTAASVVPRFG